jgi:hypothetical protein
LTGTFLYDLYLMLFVAPVNTRAKQRILETAAVSKDTWRVVSISKAALEHIAVQRHADGLRRGHILSRKDRGIYLFEREIPLQQTDLLDYFFEHDTVALVTKAENATDGTHHWSALRAVPEGHFTAGSFSVRVRNGIELIWVDQQYGTP